MEFKNLVPTLWEIIGKGKCAINISSLDNKLTITILYGKRRKTFCDNNTEKLLMDLKPI